MSHHIYTTDAYVFGHDYTKDADTFVYLFTRELGYIRAIAAGSRFEKSKHRFALQDYSACTVGLVQGKGGWRITSAIAKENVYTELKDTNPHLFAMYARVIKLLKRLLQGEEGDSHLFTVFENGIVFGGEHVDDLDKEQIRNLELHFVLLLLKQLGYTSLPKYASEEYSLDSIAAIDENHKEVAQIINKGLEQSHL